MAVRETQIKHRERKEGRKEGLRLEVGGLRFEVSG
jgi:hypothetical protein